jgi:cell division septum initiation protein DivIVA
MDEYGERGREGVDAQGRVARLERELEQERQQTRQTANLLLSATNYADSIRQRVRRDAELTLRKAREREARILGDVETRRKRAESELQRIEAALRLAEIDLRRTETERRQAEADLSQTRSELLRLRALTHEIRARLSALTTAALQVLDSGVDTPAEAETGENGIPEPTHSDLRAALQTRLSQTADSAHDARPNADEPGPQRTSAEPDGRSFGQGDPAW